jgi:hypothetical protein
MSLASHMRQSLILLDNETVRNIVMPDGSNSRSTVHSLTCQTQNPKRRHLGRNKRRRVIRKALPEMR